MAEAEVGSHTIELREWAGELQKLLPNTGEVAAGPMEKEPARSSSSLKKMYGQLYNARSLQEEEEFNHVYMPSKVGLGPRLTDHIFPNPKEASLAVVLRRSKKELFDELERYYNGLNSVVEELRGAYDNLDRRWQDYDRLQDDERYMYAISYPGAPGAFLRMMLLDGLFVLEVINRNDDNPVIKRMFENDDKKRCLHDILLLENQLPITLLLTLRTIQRGKKEINPNYIQEERGGLVSDVARTFIPSNRLDYFPFTEITNNYFDSALNILDVYRRCLGIHRVKKEKRGLIWNIATAFKPRNRKLPTQIFMNYNIFEYVPPATKLHEAGIRFKITPSTSLLDIHFSSKTLILPQIEVDSYTKSLFLNFIAFEKLHKHVAKNEVTSYMYFMGCLVHGPEDVTLLQSQGIIISRLPRAEVAAIFNRVSKDISFDPDPYSELIKTVIMVRDRYNKLSNEWRMELFQTYLKSPWAIISLVAAFLIFVLSILQTLYSILSYIHRN